VGNLSEYCDSSSKYVTWLISYIYDFLDEQILNYTQRRFLHCLSGGIDSALLLKLIVDRYGSKSIICLITNVDFFNNPNDLNDAQELCRELGVKYYFINISKAVKVFYETMPELKTQMVDNVANRVRSGLACELALKYNLRLLFAGPYSEWAIMGGDAVGGAAAHCYPFGGIFKSEIYAIARRVNLSEKFCRKKPSTSSIRKTNAKEAYALGIKLSDLEKLVMFFCGLINKNKIEHIPKDKLLFFHYLFKFFEKDLDYPCTNLIEPERNGRKEFFAEFDKFPFE
jgi:NAD+ synthase